MTRPSPAIETIVRPGEIRVSNATRLIAGMSADYGFSDPATHPLKGLDGDHLTYQLRPQGKDT